MNERSYHSTRALLAQSASGETTPMALMNHYLSRMAQLNKSLNTTAQQYYALALKAATCADRERLGGRVRGVSHRLPCTAKESSDMQGWLTTSGAHYLKDNWVTQDAPSIVCLRTAGVILMGETNVPMMTADWQICNDPYGTAHNLWNRQRLPGGSSGEAAVAVVADFIPVEFGNDLFDSLRIPTHYTGVYAHRCNLGLMLVRGHVSGGGPQATGKPGLSTADPMTRSVADLRLMVHALSTFWVESSHAPGFSRYQAKANYRVYTRFSAPYHEIDQQIT